MLDLLDVVNRNTKKIDRWLPQSKKQNSIHVVKRVTFLEWLARYFPHVHHYDHVITLATVLQRVADGELKRVMVFEPPRHGKSLIVSELFPAYLLSQQPKKYVALCSYGAGLAYTLSHSARDNFTDAGGTLDPSSRGVEHWQTSQGGKLFAAGVGGKLTGKGFHYGIVDDPLKDAEEAESETIREKHKRWWNKTFYTRREPNAAIIVVQTRWHDDDLSGWLLQQETQQGRKAQNWHIVCMPAIKDVPLPFPATCTVEPDDREIGEALCPERYPIDELLATQSQDRAAFQALYQQNPVTEGGNIFKAIWWDNRNRYGSEPAKIESRAIFLDTAIKDEEWNDNTAWTVLELLSDYRVRVIEIDQTRIESADLPELIEGLANRFNHDGKLAVIVLEDKGSGTTAGQTLRKTAPAWIANIVYMFMPHGSKQYRAKQASVWCGKDCVLMPSVALGQEWVHGVLDPNEGELMRFPRTKHDDRVDSFSMGIIYMENYLSTGWLARVAESTKAA